MKRAFLLIFYLMAGVILGALLANLCQNVPFLNWLAYSKSLGISPDSPFVLDLSVLQVSFSFAMHISAAQVITIAMALFAYTRTPLR